MSAIYRAYDTVMGREVALKRLLPVEETNLNEASGESLAREAAALARFSHQNVVTVFAFEEDDEGPFVVMELVEGEDLHTIIKSGALSWDDFRDVAPQCLEPLVSAGELNLLHRDIKPGNLMLKVTPTGRYLVKLLDFGLAKFSQQPSLQTLDQRGSFLGSIDFIAPEQLELRPLDQRTDLYSLGCVFYYMLARESPFTGGNPAETSMNHIRHRCQAIGELRSDLPPLVADWIMRLISRYPEDRPDDAKDALRQFEEALAGKPYQTKSDPFGFESDDVPFAVAVAPPPSEPISPPSSQVTPATGSVPTRTIRTASGPIPAGRLQTGPARGGQLPSKATGRHAPRTGTNPRAERPMRASSRPLSSRSATFGDSTRRWIFAAGGGLVALLVVLLLFRGGGGEEPTAASGSEEVASRSEPVPLPPLPHPKSLHTSDGQPDPPELPVADDLFARFVAGKGVLGRDYRSAPPDGGQAAAWVNLADPGSVARSLLRDSGDPNGTHLPVLGRYDGTAIPGLRGAHRGIATTNRSALTMLRNDAVLQGGFTLFVVTRIEAGDDRLLRLQPPVWDNRFLHFATGYDARLSAVVRFQSLVGDARISVSWPNGRLGVFSYTFDAASKSHRLVAEVVGETSPLEAEGPLPFEGLPFGLLAIGKRGFGDGFDDETGNVVFEIVVYDRVLSETESRSVIDHLAARYFDAGE